VAQLLTHAWMRALVDAASAADVTGWPTGERLVIEQIVTGTASGRTGAGGDGGTDDEKVGDVGDVSRWALEISGEGVSVTPGISPDPDLTLVADVATASAIALGTLNAQQALAAGRLHVRGDLARLAALRDALAALGDVFAEVRPSTEAAGA